MISFPLSSVKDKPQNFWYPFFLWRKNERGEKPINHLPILGKNWKTRTKNKLPSFRGRKNWGNSIRKRAEKGEGQRCPSPFSKTKVILPDL